MFTVYVSSTVKWVALEGEEFIVGCYIIVVGLIYGYFFTLMNMDKNIYFTHFAQDTVNHAL